MNFRQFQLWLALALAAPSSLAFSPTSPSIRHDKPLDMTATLDISTRQEIDISDVLAQAEAALMMAQESVPNSETMDKELVKFSKMQTDMEASIKWATENASGEAQMVATAMAGSAIGVVAGSPLVLGAALGYAGSQIYEDEKKREMLEKLGAKITEQLHGAIEFAKTEIENEEDPSKIPEKMLQAVQLRTNAGLEDVNHALEEAKNVPTNIMSMVKGAMESEDLKQAPGRAFSAFKGFWESDEVKAMSSSTMKALKASLESDEMKALQNRASKAVKDSLAKKA
jgi:hypothetical protein